VIECFKNC